MTDYDPTIEDSYTKQCVIDDVVAKLDSKMASFCVHTLNNYFLFFQCSTGHSRSGGVQCNARAIHALWRRFSASVLCG